MQEHADALIAACKGAMQILEGSPDRAERLARIDPVPASTEAILRRLALTSRNA
ncbi:MAG: hypothetical protein NVSMB57_16610 [Actinomycetota bacterium]